MTTNGNDNSVLSSPYGWDLHRMLQLLLRRLNWILGGLILGTLCATLYIVLTDPVFEAASLVMIQPYRHTIASYDHAQQEQQTTSHYYKSQYQLLKSLAVCQTVADVLGVKDNPRSEFYREAHPAEAIQARVTVQPERDSFLLSVKVQGKYPDEVQRLVNEIVKAYMKLDAKRRKGVSGAAVQWLEANLPKIRKELDAARKRLLAFQEANGAVTVNGRMQSLGERLDPLHLELSKARLRRIGEQTRYRRVRDADPETYVRIPVLVRGGEVDRLLTRLMDLRLRRAEQIRKLGPKHATVHTLARQAGIVREKLQEQLVIAAQELKGSYEQAKAEEQKLQVLVNAALAESKVMSRKTVRFEALQRKVDRLRRLYEPLAQRLEEVSLLSSMTPLNVHVVDKAQAPSIPIKPRVKRSLGFGILVGLMLGIALALLVDRLEDRIASLDELTLGSRLRVLGQIPYVGEEAVDGQDGVRPPVCLSSPSAPASELFRALRTSLLLSRHRLNGREDGGRVVLVTSAQKGDGKTLVALNLAIVLAQAGKQTLAMDCDLRNPCLHGRLGLRQADGLGTALAGYRPLDEVVLQTDVKNLALLASGPRPPRPSELLGSTGFETLIGKLRAQYDWIIIDSPPLLAVTDSMVLASVVDGVIQVVRAGFSRRRLVERGTQLLETAGACQLGVVLNDTPEHNGEYDYYD